MISIQTSCRYSAFAKSFAFPIWFFTFLTFLTRRKFPPNYPRNVCKQKSQYYLCHFFSFQSSKIEDWNSYAAATHELCFGCLVSLASIRSALRQKLHLSRSLGLPRYLNYIKPTTKVNSLQIFAQNARFCSMDPIRNITWSKIKKYG